MLGPIERVPYVTLGPCTPATTPRFIAELVLSCTSAARVTRAQADEKEMISYANLGPNETDCPVQVQSQVNNSVHSVRLLR